MPNDWSASEDWASPVGTGAGPVHGPMVPEPSGVLALSGGLLGLLGLVRKRRG